MELNCEGQSSKGVSEEGEFSDGKMAPNERWQRVKVRYKVLHVIADVPERK